MKKILIIDDEADICLLLKKFLTKSGFEVDTALNGEDGVALLKKSHFDLVICDFKLPDYTGIDILQKIKIINHQIQVILITGYSDVKVAVDALKKGAYDYVTKPLRPDEILATINQALKSEAKAKPTKKAKKRVNSQEYIVGKSSQSQLAQKHIELIAPTDMSVIILGETGTGKEYVAKSIHQKSTRANGPFVAIDCGALPEELAGSELFGHVKGAFTGAISDKVGCFELANGGTLFMDELGNLSYENQVKLLRVLQERILKRTGGTKEISVDVRVVVATNENLHDAVQEGGFREDVYHRLNEFQIQLAPLRSRPDDVEVFAAHFLQLANEQLDKDVQGFDEEVTRFLRSYFWHGNLRELQNVVKRSVLMSQSDLVTAECLPVEITTSSQEQFAKLDGASVAGMTLKEVVAVAEKNAIAQVLKQTKNNKTKTAVLLDIDRKTLYNKLNAYGLMDE